MGVIQSLGETSDKAVDVGEKYYKKTQEYYKLKAFQVLTLGLSTFCKILIMGGLLLIGLIFFAVSGTIALSQLLDSTVIACLIIGISLFLLSGIVFLLRKKIENLVIRKISPNFFE